MSYGPQTEPQLSESLRHQCRVWAETRDGAVVDLDVEDGDLQVTFDESWSPYAQANGTAALPAGQDDLDALDPREGVRVHIQAGYTYQSGVTEITELATLGLRDRRVTRPANTMRFDAASDEARAQDRDVIYFAETEMPHTGINEAVARILELVMFYQPFEMASSYPAGTFADIIAEFELRHGDNMWAALDQIATMTGKRIYCDETGTWRLTDRAQLAGTPSLFLTVGQDGTIVDSEAGLDREDWANCVVLRNDWEETSGETTTRHHEIAVARIVEGPLGGRAVGFKVHRETSDRAVTSARLDSMAVTKLRKLSGRGRSLRLTAIAAYWLRPGHTIQVQLPTGPAELHLVEAVTFRPLVGLMDITTRQPLNVTIETGE